MTYDGASNLETITDALGNTTTNHYDNMNRLKTSIDALNQNKERQYDNRGNLKQVVDPATENRAKPVITSATYNPKGQVKTITDPEGNTQSYDYDVLGNLLTETTPFGGKYSYTYNNLNLLKSSTNARGQTATYSYDAAGRITSLTDQVDSTSYTYDENGNLLTVSSANAGTITRTFDKLNRVKTYTDASGNTIQYDYDGAGNLKKLTYPNGQAITYSYDSSGLLTDTVDFKGGTTHYDYDNNGRIKTITRPNGTTRTTTYDKAGQVKTIIDQNAKGEIISNYSFDYDAGGKIKEEKGLNENLTVTKGEIIMTYGKGNRLLTYNGQEVTYDADDNMTYGPLNGKMVEFKYDARNRLIEAGTTTYQYDAENNRIGKTENGKQTTYIVDTTSSALSRVLVEKQGNTVRQYIYATGLIMHVEGGEYATYHYDNRGSTVAITNSQGKVTDTFTYGPYGEQCGRKGKTRTPFLYNGRYGVETDTNGLYYMRARYYNPDIKRFINQDVVQGSLDNAITLNRFAYANGNPISFIDPFGLVTMEEAMVLEMEATRKNTLRPKTQEEAMRIVATQEKAEERLLQEQLRHAQIYRDQVLAENTIIPSTPYKNAYKIWQDSIDEAIDLFGLYERGSKEHIGWEIYACYNCYTKDEIIRMDGSQRTVKMAQMVEGAGANLAGATMGAIWNGTAYGNTGKIPSQGRGNNVSNCFVAGTLIATEEGLKPIEEIKVGDYVWSEEPISGEKGLKRVANTFVHDKKQLVYVYIDGKRIDTTEEHPFWVEGKGWILAGQLKKGDVLRLKSDKNVKVTNVEYVDLEELVKVYNFEVEDWHTYFVSEIDVLVHNKPNINSNAKNISGFVPNNNKWSAANSTMWDWKKKNKYTFKPNGTDIGKYTVYDRRMNPIGEIHSNQPVKHIKGEVYQTHYQPYISGTTQTDSNNHMWFDE